MKTFKKRWLIVAAAVLLFALLIFAAFYNGLTVSRYTVSSALLPDEFNGFHIVFLSDTHGSFIDDGKRNHLVGLIKKLHPDIIALGGDILAESNPKYETFDAFLKALTAVAPVYAVSGNHDRWQDYYNTIYAEYEANGVVFLENKSVVCEKDGAHIYITGFADPEFWNTEVEPGCMDKTIKNLPPIKGEFNLLLFHRANVFDEIKGKGYQLVLSGHLHGGVVRLPFLGPVAKKSAAGYLKYAGGMYKEDDTTLIVSRGLGNNIYIPRIFNPPDVVCITLKTAK